ncbi:tRNA pseudouridine(13) synthase TruD [Flocculibacter collagenilyticus]|uniref:tRNA pseudouridine(13) synthase TruD n=1 Tax=Flocculibacter collagenilyticus TaxID=2744479 RepID=UPI0018F5D0BA|nr:tRNA pseudouridine(13) synthase TruD [Flocculibacter collagenilyticus]
MANSQQPHNSDDSDFDFKKQFNQLAYLHGTPEATGVIRRHPDDFRVEEQLDFELTGEGEHVCLYIEKIGENTQFVAKKLAKFAGVKIRDVSYAGLKDRNAITRQWFSVPVPIKKELDWDAFSTDTIKVIEHTRHQKKLRTGCLSGNKFTLVIRDIENYTALVRRLGLIESLGVPNYFGEQRFGIEGNNLQLAERMFAGEAIRDKKLRGLVISAARSWLFNLIVSKRAEQNVLTSPLEGDLFMFPDVNSYFAAPLDEPTLQRLAKQEICLSAPLVGNELAFAKDDAGAIEQSAVTDYQAWIAGLDALRAGNDRRRVILKPLTFTYEKIDDSSIVLSFTLPSGCFATSLLREAINYSDYSDVLRSQYNKS